MGMISVEEALAQILDGVQPIGAESHSLDELAGRILAADVVAAMTQPPHPASAMDGYAVRFSDAKEGAILRVIGEAPAGTPFNGAVGAGEAVRIFTGGVVPEGADHILIQEEAARDGDAITVTEDQDEPRHIRPAGIDFIEGAMLARAGEKLHAAHSAIFAAANVASVRVFRRPRVALFSNGDELVEPGAILKPGEIVNSNHYALTEFFRSWGGRPEYLGCAPDSEEAIRETFRHARDTDIIVPVGGASVGDYDYVKSAFRAEGGEIFFEKVAVRPGKPTWLGRLGNALIIGLPGNPASAICTAALFVQPLIRRLAGDRFTRHFRKGRLAAGVPANGPRETYLRAEARGAGEPFDVDPAPNQDSSLLLPFAKANALVRRPPNTPALEAGSEVEFLRLR
ncbi:MAG: molybdopterin molybdotransferase MoeA [Parvularculaceae bacterium]